MIEYNRKASARVDAATEVLKSLYEGGSFIVDPVEAATRMLEAADKTAERTRLFGYMKDGAKVAIEFQDKGDLLPGYDENRNRYEAFTSWWRLWFLEPRGPNGEQIMEDYVQVERREAEIAADVDELRWEKDMLALDSMGVDTKREFVAADEAEFRKIVMPISIASWDKAQSAAKVKAS
jgi:hypothetical protein